MDNIKYCYFDDEVKTEMENFKRDFLANRFKKDQSVNQGPNYRTKLLHEDKQAFYEYLESDFAIDFINLN